MTLYNIRFDILSINQLLFPSFQWNASTSYNFEIPREFGTDYGICCWYTPQHNFTEIYHNMIENNLTEPDWAHYFLNIPKVSLL